jgi:hypothetical protein
MPHTYTLLSYAKIKIVNTWRRSCRVSRRRRQGGSSLQSNAPAPTGHLHNITQPTNPQVPKTTFKKVDADNADGEHLLRPSHFFVYFITR